VIATHCVESYFHRFLFLGDFYANNFFALIESAGGANPVGQFSAFALGAKRKTLRLDFPVRTTLIPALT
jgi:hypothetical protein